MNAQAEGCFSNQENNRCYFFSMNKNKNGLDLKGCRLRRSPGVDHSSLSMWTCYTHRVSQTHNQPPTHRSIYRTTQQYTPGPLSHVISAQYTSTYRIYSSASDTRQLNIIHLNSPQHTTMHDSTSDTCQLSTIPSNPSQLTSTDYNTLEHTTTHTAQYTLLPLNMPTKHSTHQLTITHPNAFQCTPIHHNILQYTPTHSKTFQRTPT